MRRMRAMERAPTGCRTARFRCMLPLGKEHTMSGKTIGLLGAGRIGAMHAGILAKKAGKLVVADPASWRARRVAELHGAEVRSPEGMLASEDLDGLVLATPTDTHAGLLCEAARLGVPIFCEKPVALDVESTRRANAAATAMPPASTTASSTVSPPNPPSRTSPLLRHTL